MVQNYLIFLTLRADRVPPSPLHAPKRPERLGDRALRLGDAVFRWEDDMDATYAAVPGGWRVSLTIPPTQHASRAFIVSE